MSTSTRFRVLTAVVGLVAPVVPVLVGLAGDAGSASPAAAQREPAQRYLVALVNKTTVKKGKKVTIHGLIQPPTAPAECLAGVVLDVGRATKGATYVPIGTVTTDATGAYSVKETVKKKCRFRISAPGNDACVAMQSPPRTVNIK